MLGPRYFEESFMHDAAARGYDFCSQLTRQRQIAAQPILLVDSKFHIIVNVSSAPPALQCSRHATSPPDKAFTEGAGTHRDQQALGGPPRTRDAPFTQAFPNIIADMFGSETQRHL